MADLLAAALEYSMAGIHVFPARVTVNDQGKKIIQPVASWRQASSKDPRQLRAWFEPGQRWADASLCIDCGKSGLVVVDLDVSEGKDGHKAWAEIVANHDIEVTPVRTRTPSGGEHWYYREFPERVVGNDSTGKVGPGVDVRGLGGFVIAWPSTDIRGAYGELDPAALATVPNVPDLVAIRLSAPSPAQAAASGPTSSAPERESFPWDDFREPRRFTVEQARAFCQEPLAAFRALRTPEDSGFNAKLNALACVWSHFVPEFMSARQAEATLYAAAEANRSVEWQGESGVRATIRSGLNQTRDPWKAVRVEPGEVPPAAESDAPAPGAEEWRSRRTDLQPFLDGTYRAPEPAVGALLDTGRPTLYAAKWHTIVGPTGAGKSWAAIAHVREELLAGRKVTYLHFEEIEPAGTVARLLAVGVPPAVIAEHFVWLPCDRRWVVGELAAELGEIEGLSLVVLDGINAACGQHGLDVEKSATVGVYRALFVTPAVAAGAAVISLGHPPKAVDRQTERHGFGSTAWLDLVDGVGFRLRAGREAVRRGGEGFAYLDSVKDRYGEVERHGVAGRSEGWVHLATLRVDDTQPGRTSLVLVAASAAVQDEREVDQDQAMEERVLAAVTDIEAAGRVVSQSAVRAMVTGRNGEIDQALTRLVIRGVLEETRGDRNARVYDLAPADLEDNPD